jgi:tetratricopeptide (TPR) repeat protein
MAAWMQDALREGFAYLAAGRLTEASACCQRLLGAKPDLVEAHFLVGLVALELKEVRTAVSAFGSVTKLKEDHGAAWANLARLFMLAGQAARASMALENAVKYNDGNPIVLDLIGTIYGLFGDYQEAAKWIDQAVQKQPHNIAFLVNRANNHMFLGELDDAEAANWILSNLRKATNHDHVEVLERLVDQEGRNPRALAFLYYALGKELEDLEDWDNAFAAFARGARARRSTVEFDEASEKEMFQAFGDTFTNEWISTGPAGHGDPSPVFVIGQPRTGTTLVERIITSHSQVHSAGELKQFGISVRRLSDYREPKRYSARLAHLAASIDSAKLGQAYIAMTAKFRGSLPRFVDKLPPNYLYLPLILKSLPNAKIIHLTRNPMDACFASFKQLFADAYPHSYDQAEMARHHARYYHLMALWRDRFGDRFLDLSYEAIASSLEPNARTLIDFLELPWEDACLDFHRQTAPVATASAVQVREPVHTRSIGRWRRYAGHLSVMRETLHRHGVSTDEP